MKKLWLTLSILVLSLGAQNAFAACASPTGTEGEIIYNSTAKMLQFCNGTVWVNASGVAPGAGSSGSGPTYEGVTTSTYDGNSVNEAGTSYDGLLGMNAICAADYAGSRMMMISDLQWVWSDITDSTTAWIHANQAGSPQLKDYVGTGNSNFENDNCAGTTTSGTAWGSTSGSQWAMTYRGDAGAFVKKTCSSTYKIHCVTD